MRKKAALQPTLPESLSRLPKQTLVACLADLAARDDKVQARIEALRVASDPSRAAALVRRRLAGVRRSTRHHWGFEGASAFAHSLDEILDVVEKSILPVDATAAMELIAAFIECDAAVFERADDSSGYLGTVFHRACGLFGTAAARVPSRDALARLEHLRARDDYGARRTLMRVTAGALDEPARAELMEKLRQQTRSTDEHAAATGALALQDLADAIGDPELYEEACHVGPHAGNPVYRLRAAQRYLRVSRAAEALSRLPQQAEECGGYAHEWTETHTEILRVLGRTDELRATLWQQFCAAPSKARLDAWLECEPGTERPTLLARAREEVLRDRHDPTLQVRFFVELGETDVASQCVLRHAAHFDGSNYHQLKPLAEALTKDQALAATILYRALLEGNLGPALSKYYSHGVRYLRALEGLASRISEWAPLPSHADSVSELRAVHGRKTAFWSRVDRT